RGQAGHPLDDALQQREAGVRVEAELDARHVAALGVEQVEELLVGAEAHRELELAGGRLHELAARGGARGRPDEHAFRVRPVRAWCRADLLGVYGSPGTRGRVTSAGSALVRMSSFESGARSDGS